MKAAPRSMVVRGASGSVTTQGGQDYISQAGLNSYKLSVKEWVTKTEAIG